MSRIQVHIDSLVLPEMDIRDRNALIEGLRAELALTLSDAAGRTEWGGVHRMPLLKLGGIPLGPGNSGAGKFGANLGRAIGKGVKP